MVCSILWAIISELGNFFSANRPTSSTVPIQGNYFSFNSLYKTLAGKSLKTRTHIAHKSKIQYYKRMKPSVVLLKYWVCFLGLAKDVEYIVCMCKGGGRGGKGLRLKQLFSYKSMRPYEQQHLWAFYQAHLEEWLGGVSQMVPSDPPVTFSGSKCSAICRHVSVCV